MVKNFDVISSKILDLPMARTLTYYLEPNNIVWINHTRVDLLENEGFGRLVLNLL